MDHSDEMIPKETSPDAHHFAQELTPCMQRMLQGTEVTLEN